MRNVAIFSLIFSIGCTKSSAPETTAPAKAPEKSQVQVDPEPKVGPLVTLGGSITETVFALGQGDKVVGVDVSSLYPLEATKLPKVGYYRQVSAEGVISLAPKMVIASASSGPKDVLEKITNVGIRLESIPATKTFAGAKARIQAIAKLIGAEDKGNELIAKLDQQIQGVKKAETPKKVLFIYARGAGSLNVAGTKNAADEMIRLAGGVNAVSEYEGYKPINSESIVAAAPDVILMTSRGLKSVGGAEAVAQLKGISLTPAAKNKAIIEVDDLLLLGFGPRTGEAVTDLAAKLSATANAEPKP